MKTKFKIYKLHFTTPLHIGDERDDYSISLKTYQSDAMYAALTSSLAKIGVEIPDNGDLGVNISSLFPFYQKSEIDKAVYFFPKLLKMKLPKLEHLSDAKKVKKVNWIELSFFEKLINGDKIFEDMHSISQIRGEFLSSSYIGEQDEFISSQVSQRVTVSRNFSEDAKPFYMDRIYFSDYSGLYFLAEGDTKLLDIAMNILQHEGIGTDRNIGNGFFTYSIDEIEIDLPESNYIANLSMYCPETEIELNAMLNDKEVAYDFVKRGGWVTTMPHNKIRKNTIHMFTPASVFHSVEKRTKQSVMGKIVDLNPKKTYTLINHPIWRNGKSLFIPIKI